MFKGLQVYRFGLNKRGVFGGYSRNYWKLKCKGIFLHNFPKLVFFAFFVLFCFYFRLFSFIARSHLQEERRAQVFRVSQICVCVSSLLLPFSLQIVYGGLLALLRPSSSSLSSAQEASCRTRYVSAIMCFRIIFFIFLPFFQICLNYMTVSSVNFRST